MDGSKIKNDVRQILLLARKAFDREEVETKSKSIFERWKKHFSSREMNYFHVFNTLSHLNEINTDPFQEYIRDHHPSTKVVFPVMIPSSKFLKHVCFDPDIKMVKNAWGIPEPEIHKTYIRPQQIDMVIVPMLGFDEHGNRLGYGKGYYDRFLAKVPEHCIKIGVCYEFGFIDVGIPAEEHDISMNFVITEERIREFPQPQP